MIFGSVLRGRASRVPCGPLGRRPLRASNLGRAARPGLSSGKCGAAEPLTQKSASLRGVG